MRDFHVRFLGDDRAGHGGVHVADDDHAVGLVLTQNFLKSRHQFAGLLGGRARADIEIDIGAANVQLLEGTFVQGGVVMLAGVKKDRLQFRLGAFERARTKRS